jgi:hypothetical protein
MSADPNAEIRGGMPSNLPDAGKLKGSGWNLYMTPGGIRATTNEKGNGTKTGMKNSGPGMDTGKKYGCGSDIDQAPTGKGLQWKQMLIQTG